MRHSHRITFRILRHFTSDSEIHGGFASFNINVIALQRDNRRQRIVQNNGIAHKMDAVGFFLWIKVVWSANPIKRGAIDVKIANIIQNTDVVAMIMPIDRHKHAIFLARVGFIEDFADLHLIFNAIRVSTEAFVADRNARIRGG